MLLFYSGADKLIPDVGLFASKVRSDTVLKPVQVGAGDAGLV